MSFTRTDRALMIRIGAQLRDTALALQVEHGLNWGGTQKSRDAKCEHDRLLRDANDLVALRKRLAGGGAAAPAAAAPSHFGSLGPRLGSEYRGGIYGGLTFRNDNPVGMILLPGDFGPMNWDKSVACAKENSGDLPLRIDQLMLLQRLKDQFKREYYWSAEPYAPYPAYAWAQYFANGLQLCCRKHDEFRVRLVRTFSLID
jgi:hypothetical protein